MVDRGGIPHFILDTATSPELRTSHQLRASAYMERFDLGEEYRDDWLQQIAAGKTYVTPTFQHDEYGDFLTAHAPIYDREARYSGFVGVDFDLQYYFAQEARFRTIGIGSLVAALIMSLVIGYVVALYHSAMHRRVIDLGREVMQRRAAEHELHRLARHDVLTGLPNRRWFMESFSNLRRNLPEGQNCAVLVVDLDNFKPINDLYGHRLGDEVLRVVAKRLSALVEDGSVARLGGDEFGILLHCPADGDAGIDLARRIVSEIPKPIPLAALSLQVGVSVGVAMYDPADNRENAMAQRDGAEVETVLRQADMAMYLAKAEGRGQYYVFDATMDERLQARVELEAEIETAIAEGQIVPYYQRIVDLETSETIGFEVLARWEHPTRGLILPDTFVPIAEDTGMTGEMVYGLLERSIDDAKAWPQHLYLSINVSPRQISDPSLPQRVLEILSRSSFAPHRLVIEITENAVVQKLDEAKAVLAKLRDAGVRVALDDFGTGYSALYHLRELDPDTLKIDRSFTSQMLHKPEEARIVKAIVSLSKALGLHTTAEGIEHEEVLERLMKLGCDAGQGFLFGKPEPAAIVTAALRKEMEPGRQVA
jgi:diguanylate cyclase (GGDEF)-like protein